MLLNSALEQGACTDDDCLVPPNFLSRLLKGYKDYPEVIGVGGYMEAAEDVLQGNVLAQYEAYVTHQTYHAGSEPYVGGFECPAGGTGSMSYYREVLDQIDLFDETFPVPGGEDADLKRRIVEDGGRLLYVPVKVIHIRPYTLASFWHQYRSHGRGVIHYERKFYGKPPSYGRLVLRTGVRVCRWGLNLFRLGPGLATARMIAELADVAGQWYELKRCT